MTLTLCSKCNKEIDIMEVVSDFNNRPVHAECFFKPTPIYEKWG